MGMAGKYTASAMSGSKQLSWVFVHIESKKERKKEI